ncbi:MAG: sulfotransferase family protein [Bacteroidia bacterium]
MTISEIEKIRKMPFVFILGNERSGTTLLQTILNSHPNIVAPPEAKFMMLLFHRFFKIKTWSGKDILDFVEGIYTDPQFVGFWHINRDQIIKTLLSVKEQAGYAMLCKMIYLEMSEGKQDIMLICDKNPLYILFINEILKIYPLAKFIHIIRDPRDNVYSNLKTFHTKNAMFNACKWVAYNSIIEKSKKKMPERYCTIQYEKLAYSPAEVLIPLCAFLGVPYIAEMSEHKSFQKSYAALDDETKTHVGEIQENLFNPINTSQIGKWEKEMKEQDIRSTEIIAGRFAQIHYGYKIEQHKESNTHIPHWKLLKSKFMYYCWQIFTRLRFKSYRFNIMYCKIRKEGRIA